jgi:hypothetical protein
VDLLQLQLNIRTARIGGKMGRQGFEQILVSHIRRKSSRRRQKLKFYLAFPAMKAGEIPDADNTGKRSTEIAANHNAQPATT